jgi:diacylglycerol O-acyltransferase
MNWAELCETGQTWRVRVHLADHPGELALVAARLSERGCNLLGVTVLPVVESATGDEASVVDELVLRAPAELLTADLTALVEVPGARCVGVVPASVTDLIDAPTGVLRAVSAALSGAITLGEAVRQVLAADSITVADGPSHGGLAGSEAVRLERNAHRVTITLPTGQQVAATRDWAPFTEVELARIPALLDVMAYARSAREEQLPSTSNAAGDAASAGASAPARRGRRQLSSLDVQFLNAETATTFTHVGGLTVLDAAGAGEGPVTIDRLRRLIGSRLHLIAPLRWRLHQVPLGLDLPYWLDVGEVDLEHHIREIRLPGAGTDEELAELVARLAATPLDRSRPLWECHLVHGLAGGRQALYTKVHHAVIDGVSCAEVLSMVLDVQPVPSVVPAPQGEPVAEAPPSTLEMLRRGAARGISNPLRIARSAPSTLPHLLDLPGAATVPGAGLVGGLTGRLARLAGRCPTDSVPPRPPTPPVTPFNMTMTARRAFAFVELPLADVKAVKNSLGFTLNDVVMALCTTALRRWLIEQAALPDGPIVASIPVSVRTPEQVGMAGNEISFMLAALPTDVADPVQRLASREPRRTSVQSLRLQRRRAADPALRGRRACAGELSSLGRQRDRWRDQHHRDVLRRSPRLRHHQLPRSGAGRVERRRIPPRRARGADAAHGASPRRPCCRLSVLARSKG